MNSSPFPPTAPLRGIVAPLITPLIDRDALDAAGLERLVEHVLGGGVQGLFILGTTGEGPSLGHRVRCEMIDQVCDQVQGRVPVLVGITDTSFVESVNLAEYAADAGASAVVFAPPCYFPIDQDALARHVEQLAPELPLRLLLYDIPNHANVGFELATIRRLLELPSVIGVKDSSADMVRFHRLRKLVDQRPDWTLLVGPEELLAEAVLSGADGGVSGGSNLAPRLYVDLLEAARRRDLSRVARLHARVMQISERIYASTGHPAGVIAGLKGALACLGLIEDVLVEPLPPLEEAQRAAIRRALMELDMLDRRRVGISAFD